MNKIIDKDLFIKSSSTTLLDIVRELESSQNIKVKHLKKEETAIIVIDMINGFAKEGSLYSDRIENTIPYIEKLNSKFKDYKKVFFADTHTKDSIELQSFPEHAIENTIESQIVDELKPFIDEKAFVIGKNSTNGFMSREFTELLMNNPQISNFVIMGCCTDICVMQFSLSLKAYFNEWNIPSRVIVPIKSVETFDLKETNHNAELMNVFALYAMKQNGIEIVGDIK